MFCFTFRYERKLPEDDVAAQQEVLRDVGWEVPEIVARMPQARTFYFDRASQIRMPSWSRGRVALIGDAAACPSLLAGLAIVRRTCSPPSCTGPEGIRAA